MPHPAGPFTEDLKTRVRLRGAIEVQPMAVEAPGQRRIVLEPVRIGEGLKSQTQPGVRRIRLPESLGAPEVRQAGVHAHAGAGPDEQCIGRGNRICRFLQ